MVKAQNIGEVIFGLGIGNAACQQNDCRHVAWWTYRVGTIMAPPRSRRKNLCVGSHGRVRLRAHLATHAGCRTITHSSQHCGRSWIFGCRHHCTQRQSYAWFDNGGHDLGNCSSRNWHGLRDVYSQLVSRPHCLSYFGGTSLTMAKLGTRT